MTTDMCRTGVHEKVCNDQRLKFEVLIQKNLADFP